MRPYLGLSMVILVFLSASILTHCEHDDNNYQEQYDVTIDEEWLYSDAKYVPPLKKSEKAIRREDNIPSPTNEAAPYVRTVAEEVLGIETVARLITIGNIIGTGSFDAVSLNTLLAAISFDLGNNVVRKIVVFVFIFITVVLPLLSLVRRFISFLLRYFRKVKPNSVATIKSKPTTSDLEHHTKTEGMKIHSLVKIFAVPTSSHRLRIAYVGIYKYRHLESSELSVTSHLFNTEEEINLAKLYYENFSQSSSLTTPVGAMLTRGLVGKENISIFNKIMTKKLSVRIDNFTIKSPVIDVYGKVYDSVNSMLCASYPIVARVHPSLNNDDDESLSITKPYVSDPSSANKFMIWAHDENNGLVLKDIDDSKHQPIDWQDLTIENVRERTETLKQMMSTLDVSQFCAHLPAAESLSRQLDPSSSKLFQTVKSVFKFIGHYNYIRSLISNDDVQLAGTSKNDEDAITFNLEQVYEETNIEFGTPLTYEELRNLANPGDAIVVHGFHVMSNLICKIQSRLRCGTHFASHKLLIVTTKLFRCPGMIDGELYAIEAATGGGMVDSTYDTLPDVFGISRSGVQIRSLRGLLNESLQQHSMYIWCPLKPEYRAKFDEHAGVDRKFKSQPCAFVSNLHKYLNKPYTTTTSNFFIGSSNEQIERGMVAQEFASMLTVTSLSMQSPLNSEFFCSELVGSLLVDCKVLKTETDIPDGANISDYVSEDDIARGFFVPRQLYPIDFFRKNSIIPYLFDKLRVINPVTSVSQN